MAHLDMSLTDEEVKRFNELKKFLKVNTRSEVVRKLLKMEILLVDR